MSSASGWPFCSGLNMLASRSTGYSHSGWRGERMILFVINAYGRHFAVAGYKTNGPLTRFVKLWVAHAPGMPGTFFSRQRLQRKPLVSGPGMHHGKCVTHVPWCMSGSLIRGGEENVPGIPGACATRDFAYLVRCPCNLMIWISSATSGKLPYS